MKRTFGLKLMAVMMMAGLSFSCQKQEIDNPLTDSVILDADIESLFDDILAEVDEFSFIDGTKNAAEYANVGNSGSRNVVTTFSGDTLVHVITFEDFVHPGDPNGRIKNGNMIIKMVGRPFLPKFWRQISFDNFTVDDKLIEGTKVMEKTGLYTLNIRFVNGKITFPDGSTCTREFDKVRTWIAGYDTPRTIWDDTFSFTGTTWGINCQGDSYSHNITTPLIRERSCKWIGEGVITSVIGDNIVVLDFGNGECDNLATLTIQGETTTIELRPKP